MSWRRMRLALANVPVLSLLLFRWWVLYGSEVVDLARTEAQAEKRAKRFAGGNVHRWNATTYQRRASQSDADRNGQRMSQLDGSVSGGSGNTDHGGNA